MTLQDPRPQAAHPRRRPLDRRRVQRRGRLPGLDVTLVRLLAVVGTILGLGSLVLVYLVAWVLVPQRTTTWS